MKKLVLFGAGKIGRSFIAQLFSQAGYETVFIDIDTVLVNLINQHKSYNIIVKDEQESIIKVDNIRAVHFSEEEKIIWEITTASIVAISVGQKGLPALFPLFSAGLKSRFKINPGLPLDIIIAENIEECRFAFSIRIKKAPSAQLSV